LHLPIIGLDVVGERLRLVVAVVVIIVAMMIILRSYIFHLVDATTLGTTLDGTFTRHLF
jgi:hypothetical protein